MLDFRTETVKEGSNGWVGMMGLTEDNISTSDQSKGLFPYQYLRFTSNDVLETIHYQWLNTLYQYFCKFSWKWHFYEEINLREKKKRNTRKLYWRSIIFPNHLHYSRDSLGLQFSYLVGLWRNWDPEVFSRQLLSTGHSKKTQAK